MPGAEAFARAFDTGQELLGRNGDVGLFPFAGKAIVAHVARAIGKGLTKIAEQRNSPAAIGFGQLQHGVELEVGRPPVKAFLVGGKRLDLIDVPIGIEQQALRPHAVPPGAPDFLVIALDALGQIIVKHETDVRFVDPHPERDGRHNDPDLIPGKLFLVPGPLGFGQARMIRAGGETLRTQRRAKLIDLSRG